MTTYKGYLIDLDGTMYRGSERVEGAKEFVEWVNERQMPHLFLTNNSSKRQEQIADKLVRLGIPAQAENIMTSSLALASYLHEQQGQCRVYMIGEEGLESALKAEGHVIVDDHPDVVVIGIDRKLSYEKLSKACLFVRSGASFLSTNSDVAIPTDQGMLPGNGAITSVIQVSTGISPQYIGKPEPIIMDQALERLRLTKRDVLMVGDNYHTDILSGIQSGIDTLMLETGVHTFKEVEAFNEQPTYKCHTLFDWINRKKQMHQ